MKNLISTISILLLTCSLINAQVVKQDLLFFSGATSFSINSGSLDQEIKMGPNTQLTEIGKTFTIDFSPKAGIMLLDKLGAGLGLNYSLFRQKFINRDANGIKTSEDVETTSTVVVGPFIRYYFQQGDNYGIYFNGEILAGSATIKTETQDDSNGIFQFGAGIGGQFFLNQNLAIEANLGYSRNTQNTEIVKNVNTGIALQIGFTFFINGGSFATSTSN